MQLSLPQAEDAENLITMAFNEDLDEAAKDALRQMLDVITARTNLTREQAYSLCSLTADLRITQIVNGNKGVHVVLPKSAL
jgi:acetamidase/formamidase